MKETPAVRALVPNILRVGLSTGIAGAIGYLITLLSSRLLGPETFGQYSIAVSLAALLLIPMQAGIGLSVLKFLPGASDRKSVFGTAGIVMLCTVTLTALFAYVWADWFVSLAHVHQIVWFAAVLLALALSAYNIIEAGLRGQLKFSLFAWMQALVPLVMGSLVLIGLFILESRSFLVPLFGIIGAYVFAVMIFSWRTPFSFVFSVPVLRRLFRYGVWGLAASVAGALLGNVDRLLLNAHIGAAALGLYAVYTMGINLFMAKSTQIIVSVLFSTSAQEENRIGVYDKLRRFSFIAVPCGLIVFPLIGAATVFIAGPDYGLDVSLLALLGINAAIYLPMNIYAWFIAAFDTASNRYTAIVHMSAAIVNISANLLLLPLFGLYGAVFAALASTMFSAVLIGRKVLVWRASLA